MRYINRLYLLTCICICYNRFVEAFHDLKIGGRDRSRLLKMAPFDNTTY